MLNIVSFKYDILDKIVEGKRYRAAHVYMMCHRPKYSYDKKKKNKNGLWPINVETELEALEFHMTLEQLAVCANSFGSIYEGTRAAAPLDKNGDLAKKPRKARKPKKGKGSKK